MVVIFSAQRISHKHGQMKINSGRSSDWRKSLRPTGKSTTAWNAFVPAFDKGDSTNIK